MPIRIKNSASTDSVVALGTRIGNKPVDYDEAYVKNLQVFPDPTTTTTTTTAASGVASVTISTGGFIKFSGGTYATVQRSTSGSGSGATFNVVLDGQTSAATSVSSITAAGSGYAVGDTITLNYTSIPDGRESIYTVLTVASLG
tara:strand:+ start:252 stop:683 length:432 start_codon:yes stop_codon:yes gene_type:complete